MLKSMLWGIKMTRRLSRGLYLCAILGEVCLRLQTLLNLFLSRAADRYASPSALAGCADAGTGSSGD